MALAPARAMSWPDETFPPHFHVVGLQDHAALIAQNRCRARMKPWNECSGRICGGRAFMVGSGQIFSLGIGKRAGPYRRGNR